MSIHEDWKSPEAPKPGMSTATKVLLALGVFGGLALLVCCGGGIFVAMKARDFAQNLAADRPGKIVEIELPPGYEEGQTVDVIFMRMAIHEKEGNSDSSIVLMEFNKAMLGGVKADQQRAQMRLQLQQQQQQRGKQRNIQVEKSEERTFTVCGKEVPFEFNVGKDDRGKLVHEVSGVFETKHGLVMLLVVADEADYDEAAVVKMIESIREPAEDEGMDEEGAGDEPAADAGKPAVDPAQPTEESKPEEK